MIIVFSSVQSYAQYYNPNSRGGLDRSIGAENRYSKEPKKEPVDYVKVMTDNLTDKLKLDGFQSAIVKNLIEEYLKNVNEIGLENIPNDAKVEKSQIARTAMEEKFTAIFSEKQKVNLPWTFTWVLPSPAVNAWTGSCKNPLNWASPP